MQDPDKCTVRQSIAVTLKYMMVIPFLDRSDRISNKKQTFAHYFFTDTHRSKINMYAVANNT